MDPSYFSHETIRNDKQLLQRQLLAYVKNNCTKVTISEAALCTKYLRTHSKYCEKNILGNYRKTSLEEQTGKLKDNMYSCIKIR